MTVLRSLMVRHECRQCGEPVFPVFLGHIVESWECPAGHEQARTLGRDRRFQVGGARE